MALSLAFKTDRQTRQPHFMPHFIFGSGTAESPISHLVRTADTATAAAAAACVQQILNHVIG